MASTCSSQFLPATKLVWVTSMSTNCRSCHWLRFWFQISIWIRLLGSLSIRQTIVILYARFSDSNTTSFISLTSLPVLLVHVEAPVRSRLEEIFPESWICREGSAGWLGCWNFWTSLKIHRNVERKFFQIHSCSQNNAPEIFFLRNKVVSTPVVLAVNIVWGPVPELGKILLGLFCCKKSTSAW